MKCLLCKGKGVFLVYKKNYEFDARLGGSDYYTSEPCPRCKGRRYEKYIPSRKRRLKELYKTYSENYTKYFKSNPTDESYEDILKHL